MIKKVIKENTIKTLVVYSSKTGNTKKLAGAVYESLKGKKEILPDQINHL